MKEILQILKVLDFFIDILFCFNFRDWNVDLIPKFLMAQGSLVKLLIHTGRLGEGILKKKNNLVFFSLFYSPPPLLPKQKKTL